MASSSRFKPKELIQICSIDTLDARGLYPHQDKDPLIIIDEAHDARQTGKKYSKLFDTYQNSPKIGFTATPYGDNSLVDDIVCPITALELMERGFLVPVRAYAPSIIDVSQVKLSSTGDYNKKDLFKASSKSEIIGDFVRDWKLYSKGRPTLLFAVNIQHAEMISKAFNDEGIPSNFGHSGTNSSARKKMMKGLVDGKIKVLCNVNIFSTGVDLPEVGCIQVCRPTQSIIWHLQCLGRGLRPAPTKDNCIIIDNAGNLLRHGSPYMERKVTLGKPDKKRVELDDSDIDLKVCKKCFYIYENKTLQCPSCGHMNEPIERKINHKEGQLKELKLTQEERDILDKQMISTDCFKLMHVARIRGFKRNWIYYKLRDKYGVDRLERNADSIHSILSEFIK
jgi:superfamily II DNA or RNA helicase